MDDDVEPVSVIADLNRLTTPDHLCATRTVTLGGVPHVVSVRGRSRENPVLVMVHGGPGTPLASTAWMWQRPVEEYFTVVHYDQRGAGRTHALTPADEVRGTLRPAQYVADAVDLLGWVTAELGVKRVVLAGHSWGTAVATLAALERPDLVSVYLGIGQYVGFEQGERESWRWVRAEAERRGDAAAAAELDALQPYPGDPGTFLEKVVVQRGWVSRYGGFAAGREGCDYYLTGDVLAPDHTEAEREAAAAGNALTATTLLPHLAALDLSRITEFPVPMVQFLGRWDQMTPAAPVVSWLERLTAPSTTVEWFEDSAHMAMYEEPGHFLLALLEHVRPLAL